MDNRKRARLEMSVGASRIDAGIGVDSADLNTTATSIAGAQSIFLSSAATTTSNSADAVGMLPANVFLTICGDENSDESQDYLAIDGNTLAHIKQEQELLAVGNGIINSSNSSSSTQATQTLPLQYRIVNQLQRQLPTHIDAISSNDSSGALSSTLSPMQLPSGCEIYLIKEYVDNIPTMLTEDSELLQSVPSTTTIKIEPDSCAMSATAVLAAANGGSGVNNTAATSVGVVAAGGGGGSVRVGNNTSAGGDSMQIVRNALPCVLTAKLSTVNGTPIITTATTTTTTASVVMSTSSDAANSANGGGIGGAKRSYILEAYKKRDDKRRATHNEVERRRRDKINSWIFKLKEMLPTDMAQQNNNINNNTSSSQMNNAATPSTNCITAVSSESQRPATINSSSSNSNNNSRPPPSDSKSQILIKACEYIKAMQDEIKSLRECLTENERLRLSNQRLQNELNKLRNERQCDVSPFNSNKTFNNNFNITLNSLNSSSNSDIGGSNSNSNSPGGITFCAGGSLIASNATRAAAFTKRELIIRDYVD